MLTVVVLAHHAPGVRESHAGLPGATRKGTAQRAHHTPGPTREGNDRRHAQVNETFETKSRFVRVSGLVERAVAMLLSLHQG